MTYVSELNKTTSVKTYLFVVMVTDELTTPKTACNLIGNVQWNNYYKNY